MNLVTRSVEGLALALQFLHERPIPSIRPRVKEIEANKQEPANVLNESRPIRLYVG